MLAWISTNTNTCGGMMVPFEYIARMKKLGIETDMFAEEGNPDLEAFYGVKVRPLSELKTTEDDVIISTRWEQCEKLTPMLGKKFQFVQGDDLQLLGDDQTREQCSYWRNHKEWELIGVSRYCLMRWNRGEVVPNGLNERFFTQLPVTKDIDILIEGNNEPNKNIPEAIALALQVKMKRPETKIVWLGRETDDKLGVECITNPKQEYIPAIYQRSKVLIKLSKSEGFCLPILEAMASGCLVVTTTMGGNDDWCDHERNCILVQDCFAADEIAEHLENGKHTWIVERGKMTAKDFNWNKSINKMLYVTGGNR